MISKNLALFLAALTGVFYTVQPTLNSVVGKTIMPRLAAMQSVSISFITIMLVNLAARDFSTYTKIKEVNPLYWVFGGILGAAIVVLLIISMPVLGSATTVSVVVTAQVIAGAVIDHFGLLGVEKNPITLMRGMGFIMLIAGVIIIVKIK